MENRGKFADSPPCNAKKTVLEKWATQHGLLPSAPQKGQGKEKKPKRGTKQRIPSPEMADIDILTEYLRKQKGLDTQRLLSEIYELPSGTISDLASAIVDSPSQKVNQMCVSAYPLCEDDVFWKKLFESTFPDLYKEFAGVKLTNSFMTLYEELVPSFSELEKSPLYKEAERLDIDAGDVPLEASAVFNYRGIASYWSLLYNDTNTITRYPNLVAIIDDILNGVSVIDKVIIAGKKKIKQLEHSLRQIASFPFFSFFFFSSTTGRKQANVLIYVDSDIWTYITHSKAVIGNTMKLSYLGPTVFGFLLKHSAALNELNVDVLSSILLPSNVKMVKVLENSLVISKPGKDTEDELEIARKYNIVRQDVGVIRQKHGTILSDLLPKVLKLAVRDDDPTILRALLSSRLDPLQFVSNIEKNALMYEACFGHDNRKSKLQCIRVIIDDGRFDPGYGNHVLFTNLPRLYPKNAAKALEILLEYPTIDFRNTFNYIAIRDAARLNRLDLIKVYEKDPRILPGARQNQVLRYAALHLNIKALQHFLSQPTVYDPSDKANYAIEHVYGHRYKNIEKARRAIKLLLMDPRVVAMATPPQLADYVRFTEEGEVSESW